MDKSGDGIGGKKGWEYTFSVDSSKGIYQFACSTEEDRINAVAAILSYNVKGTLKKMAFDQNERRKSHIIAKAELEQLKMQR